MERNCSILFDYVRLSPIKNSFDYARLPIPGLTEWKDLDDYWRSRKRTQSKLARETKLAFSTARELSLIKMTLRLSVYVCGSRHSFRPGSTGTRTQSVLQSRSVRGSGVDLVSFVFCPRRCQLGVHTYTHTICEYFTIDKKYVSLPRCWKKNIS